jgi:hypothetical protein
LYLLARKERKLSEVLLTKIYPIETQIISLFRHKVSRSEQKSMEFLSVALWLILVFIVTSELVLITDTGPFQKNIHSTH